MNKKGQIITEHDVFNGKETIPITIEIPLEFYTNLSNAYQKEIQVGKTTLTIEQYVGGVLQIGYNWLIYSGLKQFFNK